jgi:hypothetical protein
MGIIRGAVAQKESSFDGFKLVDKMGNIRMPDDYRDLYHMLGSWTVFDPKGNQMHFTYASPGGAEHYRHNKKFADGTVLVKEIHGTDHAQMATGDAHWATDTKMWFVLIKDAKGRCPNNPLWGDGWGSAFFKSDAPDVNPIVRFCGHVAAQAVPASTIIPFFWHGWEPSAGGFPAMTEHIAFLMKDLVLRAASFYLLRQDVLRAASAREPYRGQQKVETVKGTLRRPA